MKCTIGQLYEFNKIHSISNKIKVKTRFGFKNIEAVDITAKNSEQYYIETDSGKSAVCSPDHLWFNGEWKKTKTFNIGDKIDTIDGIEIISVIKKLNDRKDLYDLQVAEVKEFYANGIVSHNSSIANAIIFGLYGQIEGINLSDLPNRINKNLWVKVKVLCGNRQVIIERGLAPKLFNVELDGVELHQAGKSNIQEYLEEEIFEMPYNVFKNIIILSVNDFKSFITMTPKDKRLIVDKLFGFSVINQMYEKIKNDRKTIKDDIIRVQGELDSINQSISTTSGKLDELEKISNKENKERIVELKESLIKIQADQVKLSKAKTTLLDEYNKIDVSVTKLNTQLNKKTTDLSFAKNKVKLYTNSTCPECSKPLDTEFDISKKLSYEHIINSIPDEITKIQESIIDTKSKSKSNLDKQHQVVSRISALSTNMITFKNELTKIADNFKNGDTQFNQLKGLVKDFKAHEDLNRNNKSALANDDYFLSILEELLGENGVKNLAVKTILPGLNATLAQMVSDMHLSFHIRFNEKFDCVINHLGEDINPKTLSTGERKKADFIIIIALIKLLKLRFPQLNVLFLDEIFSSVDADGVHSILKILRNVIKDININTFVVNHTILPAELFDKRIEVFKDNGFSKFTIENIK